MNTFPRDALSRLQAAEGWLELGDWHSANAELEELPPKLRAHPLALGLRARVYAAAGKHEVALQIGSKIAPGATADAELLLALARSSCALGRLVQARSWLAAAFDLNQTAQFKLRALDDPALARTWTATDS